jgi:hypothetical protein
MKEQSEEHIHDMTIPPQHAEIELIDANETYTFGSRGSGKSSIGGGLYNLRRVFEMPRSTGVGVGISFNNLYENTVPPLKAFLVANGLVEDVHFTICKPPPKEWPKPYLGIVDKKYANTMSWYNGTAKQFISLRRKASANGVSAQWGDFDEVKFMEEKELVDEIFPIFRGNEKYFKGCSGYLSKFFMTDKNADPAHIKWLLAKRKLVDQEKVKVVLSLSLGLRKLKEEYNVALKSKKPELRTQIYAVETRLALLRSNMVYVAEISADDVRPIMGDKWYKDKQRNTSAHDWNVIYLNKDPDRPGEAFYPAWDTTHTYQDIDDIDTNLPLIIASDYQHTIAPITISQIATLPGREEASLNYVDEVYTLYPKGLREAVKLFCQKYSSHSNKTVYYVYDHTAIGKRVDAEEYNKIVVDELVNNGWGVYEIYTGQAPDHYQKYLDTIDWMKNEMGFVLPIMINSVRCPKLIISITSAATKTLKRGGKTVTVKDKDLEMVKGLDQSETTHFSDTFDMTNDAVIKQEMISYRQGAVTFAFR